MKLTLLSVCYVFACHKFSPVNSPREITSPTLKIRKLSLVDKVKLRVKHRSVYDWCLIDTCWMMNNKKLDKRKFHCIFLKDSTSLTTIGVQKNKQFVLHVSSRLKSEWFYVYICACICICVCMYVYAYTYVCVLKYANNNNFFNILVFFHFNNVLSSERLKVVLWDSQREAKIMWTCKN